MARRPGNAVTSVTAQVGCWWNIHQNGNSCLLCRRHTCARTVQSFHSDPDYFEGSHQSKKCSPVHSSAVVRSDAYAQSDSGRLLSCIRMYANDPSLPGCRLGCDGGICSVWLLTFKAQTIIYPTEITLVAP